jgi:hypothetical protein
VSADIRYIQQILGHEDIKTTQMFTNAAIQALQQVYAATHPAGFLEKGSVPRKRKSASATAPCRLAQAYR